MVNTPEANIPNSLIPSGKNVTRLRSPFREVVLKSHLTLEFHISNLPPASPLFCAIWGFETTSNPFPDT